MRSDLLACFALLCSCERRGRRHGRSARRDLAKTEDEYEAEGLREELGEAQAEEAERARAEYAEWFNAERRAKVWWEIDVVMGAPSAGDVGEEEES